MVALCFFCAALSSLSWVLQRIYSNLDCKDVRIMRPTWEQSLDLWTWFLKTAEVDKDRTDCVSRWQTFMMHAWFQQQQWCVCEALGLWGAVKCGTLEIAWCCHILGRPRLCPLAERWDFDSHTGGRWDERRGGGRSNGPFYPEIHLRDETWWCYPGGDDMRENRDSGGTEISS